MYTALTKSITLLAVASLSTPQQLPTWTLSPQIRLGALDGPNAFGNVDEMIVSPATGTLFAAEKTNLVVFGASGERRSSFGRQGEGPGEFRSVSALFWNGGRLIASDAPMTRVTRFTETGELVDSRVIAQQTITGALVSTGNVAPLSGGAYLVETVERVETAETQLNEGRLVRIDSAGNEVVLDQLRNVGLWGRISGGALMPVPLIPRSLYRVHPYASSIVVVHQFTPQSDRAGQFRVRRLSADGSVVFSRVYTYSPKRLPSSYLTEFLEGYRLPLTRTGSSIEEAKRMLDRRLPDFERPISEVRVGTDGSIWLRRESVDADTVAWWVLDERGDLVGTLRIPARLRIRHIDRDSVWGIEYDSLDVNYIVKYAIRK